jgi:hypothetical protein
MQDKHASTRKAGGAGWDEQREHRKQKLAWEAAVHLEAD